jgi:hypothetical protein
MSLSWLAMANARKLKFSCALTFKDTLERMRVNEIVAARDHESFAVTWRRVKLKKEDESTSLLGVDEMAREWTRWSFLQFSSGVLSSSSPGTTRRLYGKCATCRRLSGGNARSQRALAGLSVAWTHLGSTWCSFTTRDLPALQLVWTQQPCAAQLHLCLGKLPVVTIPSLLDTVVVTRRRRRATSFAFPSGARQRARLPTIQTLNASGGTFTTSIELPVAARPRCRSRRRN